MRLDPVTAEAPYRDRTLLAGGDLYGALRDSVEAQLEIEDQGIVGRDVGSRHFHDEGTDVRRRDCGVQRESPELHRGRRGVLRT